MNAQPTIARGPLVEAPLRFQLRSGGAPAKDSAFITCPKCEAPAFIRKSDRMSTTVKHLVCHCTNSGCGHVFRSQVSFRDTLVVGNLPQPVDLPVCPREDVPHVYPPARDGSDPDQISMFDPSGFHPPGG